MARRQQNQQPSAEWDFFSFPVYFALAVGALLGTILALVWYRAVFTVALFGVSFGTAHIIAQTLRRRGQVRRRDRAEEEERERRALAARRAASLQNEASSSRRRRMRRRGGGDGRPPTPPTDGRSDTQP